MADAGTTIALDRWAQETQFSHFGEDVMVELYAKPVRMRDSNKGGGFDLLTFCPPTIQDTRCQVFLTGTAHRHEGARNKNINLDIPGNTRVRCRCGQCVNVSTKHENGGPYAPNGDLVFRQQGIQREGVLRRRSCESRAGTGPGTTLTSGLYCVCPCAVCSVARSPVVGSEK